MFVFIQKYACRSKSRKQFWAACPRQAKISFALFEESFYASGERNRGDVQFTDTKPIKFFHRRSLHSLQQSHWMLEIYLSVHCIGKLHMHNLWFHQWYFDMHDPPLLHTYLVFILEIVLITLQVNYQYTEHFSKKINKTEYVNLFLICH